MQYNFKKSLFPLLLLSLLLSFSCNNNSNYYNGMVSSAHPIASKIGLDILKNGGNAFDAAIAVHFALSVVYPNAGNIGGGGFLVYRLNNGDIGTLDFREKAPEKSYRDMYIDDIEGELKVDDKRSKFGHLASGVPGSVDGMVKIYDKFSTVDWKTLLEPSIKLAREGFGVTEKQAKGLNNVKKSMQDKGIDLLISHDTANMYYLTGYDAWSFYYAQCAIVHVNAEEPLCFVRKHDAGGAFIKSYVKKENIIVYD